MAPATLRAWERRYGILSPSRTAGRHRVYGSKDIARVRALAALVDSGARASVAARQLAGATDSDPTVIADATLRRLWSALDAFDEPAARATVREATDVLSIPHALDHVFVPTLRRLGVEWRQDSRNIALEHFATIIMRAHFVELLRTGHGPPTCLAFCPEGERHDLGLIMSALALGDAGWNLIVLGADTPLASVEVLTKEIRPALLLIAATNRRPAIRFLNQWHPPRGCAVIAGGPGFRVTDQRKLGGHLHAGPYAALPAVAADGRHRR